LRMQQPMCPQEQTGQQVRRYQHTQWGNTTTQHLQQHMSHTMYMQRNARAPELWPKQHSNSPGRCV
jgi:hypothetical protein